SDLSIEHNSAIGQNIALMFDGTPVQRLSFQNNIVARGRYGIFGSGKGEGSVALSHYAPGSSVAGNVVIAAPSSMYPSRNHYPSSIDLVGLVNYLAGDFTLLPSSPYRDAGTKGAMVGAGTSRLSGMVAGVREPSAGCRQQDAPMRCASGRSAAMVRRISADPHRETACACSAIRRKRWSRNAPGFPDCPSQAARMMFTISRAVTKCRMNSPAAAASVSSRRNPCIWGPIIADSSRGSIP